jgi:hypothetical protein
MGVVLLLALAGAVAIAIAIYQWKRNQQRIAQLQQFCLAKGWQFVTADDEYTARWECPPFFQGRSRQARDVITGTVGQGASAKSFVAFDYSYVTDSNNGKSRSSETHRFAVCAVRLPTYLPSVCITPENALTRIGNVVTGDDIELESEDFNRRFRVQSRNAKFASDALPPRTMQTLLARSPLHFRIHGCDVLCWEPGVTTPVALLERLSTLTAFVDGIPSFVWHDYGPDKGVAQ